MKYRFTVISLSIFLSACSRPSPKATVIVPAKSIDTSRYVVLKFDTARDKYLFGKENKPANLSAAEIEVIENMIARRVAEYNKTEKVFQDSINKKFHRNESVKAVPYDNFIHRPGKYYKQFLVVTNLKGEKEVWVSCFCDQENKSYWKKDWVQVEDGGSCYFQIKINLTTNKVLFFDVNGVA